ncbi:MAG: hypothetical protein PHS05_01910, partial [Bacteroidales bacterium]|nr:hypothetical protein [Bacteroidales bacterium]
MKQSFQVLKARRICFRRWCNKSYGIFNSLKVLIKVCVISAAYSILALPISLQAQIDTVTVNKSVEIEEIIISSPQAASTYSALTRAVLVITSDEFTDLPVNSLN